MSDRPYMVHFVKPYMVLADHMWEPYMVVTTYGNHIWFCKNDHIWSFEPYMVLDRIWSSIYGRDLSHIREMLVPVYDYHILFSSMGPIYGFGGPYMVHFGPYMVHFPSTIYGFGPYMGTIYGNVRIWFHIWTCLPMGCDYKSDTDNM